MYNFGGVEVFECFGHLVDDEPDVYVLEDAFGNHIMQIGFHVLEYQVYVLIVLCPYRLVKLYYVAVLDLPQDLDFAVSSLCVCGMLEGIKDLLQRIGSLRHFLFHLPNLSVCS